MKNLSRWVKTFATAAWFWVQGAVAQTETAASTADAASNASLAIIKSDFDLLKLLGLLCIAISVTLVT